MRFQVSGIWIQILKYDASALYGIELEQVRVTSVTARRYDLTNWKAAHDKWLVVNSHLCFHRAPQSQRQLAGEEGKQKKRKEKKERLLSICFCCVIYSLICWLARGRVPSQCASIASAEFANLFGIIAWWNATLNHVLSQPCQLFIGRTKRSVNDLFDSRQFRWLRQSARKTQFSFVAEIQR